MSDNIKDNEFDENKNNANSEEKPYVPNKVNFEENDNWEFEAKALTLENNDFETDADVPEEKEVKEEAVKTVKMESAPVEAPLEKPSAKKPSETKTQQPVKNKGKSSKNAVKFTLAAVVCAIIAAVLIFFGVRFFTLPNTEEKMNPGNVALTVDKTDVSIGMYNYYYNAVSNNYISYAQQGGYQDLDPTKDFTKQKTKDHDGNEITWAQMFENETIEQIQYITAYYQEAVEHGVTLTKTQKESIESNIKSVKDAAKEADKSVDAYISETYGDYCGLATIKKLMNQSYIANNYYHQFQINNTVDEKDVDAYFEEHKDEYTEIKFAYLPIMLSTDQKDAKAKAEKQVKKYVSKIKNLDDLKKQIPSACKDIIDNAVASGSYDNADDVAEEIAKSVETSIAKSDTSFTQKGVNWLFDKNTKINDCSYFYDEANSMFFILLKTGEPKVADDEVYSVRHILIMPETDEAKEGEEAKKPTKAQWAAAEKKANKIYDEYKKGDKTEYSFALLAEKYSNDTESTSNGSSGLYGGLYEGTPLGQMVKSFEEWSTDKKRKYGDTGIVKSDYGYHIMYFVEDTTSSLYKCKSAVKSEKENDFVKSFEVKQHSGMKKTMVAKPQSSESDDDAAISTETAE